MKSEVALSPKNASADNKEMSAASQFKEKETSGLTPNKDNASLIPNASKLGNFLLFLLT